MISRRIVLTGWVCLLLLAGRATGQVSEGTSTEAPRSRVRLAEPPVTLPDFSLTSEDGHVHKFSEVGEGVRLVFFGFTNCPNVCPMAMQKLRQVYRALGDEKGGLTCVLVSIDGDRDTPTVMKQFLAPFMPGFTGLTGDPASVRHVADAFKAVFFKGMPTDRAGGYNVEHTSQVYLVDREGRLRATFYDAPVEDMIEATRRVMREKRN